MAAAGIIPGLLQVIAGIANLRLKGRVFGIVAPRDQGEGSKIKRWGLLQASSLCYAIVIGLPIGLLINRTRDVTE